ncbi:hypothetical protein [Leifsonia sp. Leaf264]|uniref:hypothetical protein n=1 Tax=Leifsonia sp. Leaf264 TaxID=1736314 RepID=UPI0006F76EC7|nr:hypothetical protein [Leifsonia sp. Leaf264]KQO98204.1 hypothetical protein ASF30_09085 [Leifsonia sp. Leaf264]
MFKKLGAVIAVAGVLVLAGCGDPTSEEEKADIQRCIKQLESTLAEAGSDRDLRQEEIDSCNDPDKRAVILGD